MAKTRHALIPLMLACLVLGGCLTGKDNGLDHDDGGPALIIDLAWDDDSDDEAFVRSTCEQAGVADFTWSLVDAEGREVAGDDAICDEHEEDSEEDDEDVLPILGLEPGEYELNVAGQDATGDTLWETTCTHLLLVRFDTGYYCDVELL